MILSFKNHLKLRGINNFSNIKIKHNDMLSQKCNICDLCYEAVIGEQELINIEK